MRGGSPAARGKRSIFPERYISTNQNRYVRIFLLVKYFCPRLLGGILFTYFCHNFTKTMPISSYTINL
ncbi:hypothetical protein E4U82_11400 [Lentibacillus salicampi]|uniref:Uncharacterized protein n=1 Tax=Lentibacillus salicampi TaxID=175306 RepID=A0A4Y9AA13_9BACI|nr:hypothetical protein E4U82_11400 [Lentibacillus salicampi]